MFHKSFDIDIISTIKYNSFRFVNQLQSIVFQQSVASVNISRSNCNERQLINLVKPLFFEESIKVDTIKIINCNLCDLIQSMASNIITTIQHFHPTLISSILHQTHSAKILYQMSTNISIIIFLQNSLNNFVSLWNTIHSSFVINCLNRIDCMYYDHINQLIGVIVILLIKHTF